MRFLAIGECMAELAPSGEAEGYQLGFAGDTFNTAWYLARCAPQIDVAYLTVIGEDAISAKMRQAFRNSGIDDQFVGTSPDKSVGLYLISLDQGERSFSYWRGQSAARTLADDEDRLNQAMAASDIVYFSGITLAILDAKRRAAFLRAIKSARANAKTIAFDPNLRPRLWNSGREMTDAIMQAAALCDIVLPSFEDEAEWFDDRGPAATADRYLGVGATTVVVKNGGAPILYVDATSRGETPVNPVDTLIDSTAAGDSFNAGFFARHMAGDPLPKAIAYAASISRQVVQQRGALVPIDQGCVGGLGFGFA